MYITQKREKLRPARSGIRKSDFSERRMANLNSLELDFLLYGWMAMIPIMMIASFRDCAAFLAEDVL